MDPIGATKLSSRRPGPRLDRLILIKTRTPPVRILKSGSRAMLKLGFQASTTGPLTITAHSERLFKKKLSLAQVRDMYHPCLRRAPGYDPLLRTKYNAAGTRGACRFWTLAKEQRGPPTDRREAEVTPHVHISHLWMMGSSCGLVVNVTDMLVTEGACSFPFGHCESDA
jgi:hypothetical protein